MFGGVFAANAYNQGYQTGGFVEGFKNGWRQGINRAAGTAVGSTSRFASSSGRGLLGKSIRAGIAENFGWHIEGFGQNAVNRGFLGHTLMRGEFTGETAIKNLMKADKSLTRMAATKLVKRGVIAGTGRVLAGLAGRALPLALNAYFMYEGYKEGGVLGALKEGAFNAAFSTGVHYTLGTLSGVGVGGSAAIGGALGLATGAYLMGEAGKMHGRALRGVEMGQDARTQSAINSSSAATGRQRSLMALNNTHLNGRMALGSEGFLMHRTFSGG